jgi:hypothetical protein
MNLAEIRKQYPQYKILSDGELAAALHQKFYPKLEFKDFSKRIGYLKGAQPEEYDHTSPEWQAKYGPTSGMSGFDKFRAGWGKAAVDIGRGAGQLVGAVSREDVAKSRVRDAPLMHGAGRAGHFLGGIADVIPAAFIPGVNTVAGASVTGAGLGLLQPSTSAKETLTNTAVGGVLSPAALLAGRGLAAVGRGAKAALWDPFTQAGQQRIAERTFQGFAGGADEAAKAAQNIRAGMADVLPGVQPTTAEVAGNSGLAQLERTLKNNPEYMTQFTERAAGNRNAMLGALDEIAGDEASRVAASGAREAAAGPLYAAADRVLVKADDALTSLLGRPSMKRAIARASELAAESGEIFSLDNLTGKSLHTLKMAMDDLLDNPQVSGIGKNETGAVRGTRNALLSWIEKNVPPYQQAREAFAAGSKLLNQMDVGSALRDKLTPALTEFGAQTSLRPESFAQAIRNGDVTAARATGMGNAKMESVLTPEQMRTVLGIGKQLGRRSNAEGLGRAAGSNTAQNLISQNVARQFLGPLGLPESWLPRAAQSTFLQSVLRPTQYVGKLGEKRAMDRLVEIGLDPELAAKVLESAVKTNKHQLLKYQGLFGPMAVLGANAAIQ